MNKDQKIIDNVKKTLSLLDNIKSIEPDPFLFTRVKEEINSHTGRKFLSSSSLAFNIFKQIVFAVLILLNLLSVISYLHNGKVNEQYRRLNIKNVVSEYSLQTGTDYLTYYKSKD